MAGAAGLVVTGDLPTTGTMQGFHDYKQEENVAFDRIMKIAEQTFKRHGFTPLYPRPVEPVAYLTKGEGGEEITKQVFGVARLTTKEITHLGLPFDRTVPLASWMVRHANEVILPYKRYNTDISWRGESAQPGRYRGFYQADADIVSKNITPICDAEGIAIINDVLEELTIGDFVFLVNHIAIPKSMIKQLDLSKEDEAQTLRIIDKMDKLPHEEITDQIFKLKSNKKSIEEVKKLVDFFNFKGDLKEFQTIIKVDETAKAGFYDLTKIFGALEILQVKKERISFCPGMVRGLEYYSGMVVETFLQGEKDGKKLSEYGSIASGGRYDNLVGSLAEKTERSASKFEDIKGTGISIGLTRLFDICIRHNLLPIKKKTTSQIMVGYRDKSLLPIAIKAADVLRREKGLSVDLYSIEDDKIKKQLTYASKNEINDVLLVMDEKSIVIRNLKEKFQLDLPSLEVAIETISLDFIQK